MDGTRIARMFETVAGSRSEYVIFLDYNENCVQLLIVIIVCYQIKQLTVMKNFEGYRITQLLNYNYTL